MTGDCTLPTSGWPYRRGSKGLALRLGFRAILRTFGHEPEGPVVVIDADMNLRPTELRALEVKFVVAWSRPAAPARAGIEGIQREARWHAATRGRPVARRAFVKTAPRNRTAGTMGYLQERVHIAASPGV